MLHLIAMHLEVPPSSNVMMMMMMMRMMSIMVMMMMVMVMITNEYACTTESKIFFQCSLTARLFPWARHESARSWLAPF